MGRSDDVFPCQAPGLRFVPPEAAGLDRKPRPFTGISVLRRASRILMHSDADDEDQPPKMSKANPAAAAAAAMRGEAAAQKKEADSMIHTRTH